MTMTGDLANKHYHSASLRSKSGTYKSAACFYCLKYKSKISITNKKPIEFIAIIDFTFALNNL